MVKEIQEIKKMKEVVIMNITFKGITGNWNEKTYNSNKSDFRIYISSKEFHVTSAELDELNELITQHTKAEDKVDMTDVIDVKDGYTKMIELDGIEKEWDGTLYIMSNLTRMIKVDGKEYKFSGRQFQKLISESNERHPEQTVE